VALATVEAIRDRSIQLIEWVDPLCLTSTRFRRFRNEGTADFRAWAEKNREACFRRFQVRNIGLDEPPQITNVDFKEQKLVLEIVIAYPQTNRGGPDNAMDRDDVMESDWGEVDHNVGLCSRANYALTYDCTPLGATKEVEHGELCDFTVIRAEYLFKRVLSIGGLVG